MVDSRAAQTRVHVVMPKRNVAMFKPGDKA